MQEPVQARKGADPLRVTVAYRCKGRRKHREKLAHKPGGDCRREDAVEASRAACRDEAARAEIDAAPDLATRAVTVMFHRLYYPTRFAAAPPLYRSESPRGPRLDLPFRAEDFDGIVFPHGAAPAR